MKNAMMAVTMAAITTTVLFGSSASGAVDSDQPIPERIQERMLERFGEDGIDANDDGVLTREEVRAFRADNQPTASETVVDAARSVGKSAVGQGDRLVGKGRRRGAGGLLHRLDVLNSETAPEGFNLDRAPEADLDGDGVLSDAEWFEFAQQKLDEILARLMARNPAIDIDADGTISDEELESFRAGYEASIRDRILSDHPEADTDGDGAISDEEFEDLKAARKAERIERILDRHPEADIDGDGDLSDDELSELRESTSRDGSDDRGPRNRRGRR